MHEIPLPLTRCMRLLAAAVVFVPAVLIGISPIVDAWRLPASLLTLFTGLLSWRRYRRWRPVVLRVGPDHRLNCILSAGDHVEVERVRQGVVAPGLVMATLIGKGGEGMRLLVPGRSLDVDLHWRLRRALLAWRPDAGPVRGSRDRQPDVRGGT